MYIYNTYIIYSWVPEERLQCLPLQEHACHGPPVKQRNTVSPLSTKAISRWFHKWFGTSAAVCLWSRHIKMNIAWKVVEAWRFFFSQGGIRFIALVFRSMLLNPGGQPSQAKWFCHGWCRRTMFWETEVSLNFQLGIIRKKYGRSFQRKQPFCHLFPVMFYLSPEFAQSLIYIYIFVFRECQPQMVDPPDPVDLVDPGDPLTWSTDFTFTCSGHFGDFTLISRCSPLL